MDNHDSVVINLQADTLECEVKLALGSITTNKSSGGDGIPVELFQILKDDASKFGKFCSGPRTGKGQFSFQSEILQTSEGLFTLGLRNIPGLAGVSAFWE